MGGGESDYSVCPRLLLQFFQFMSVWLCQVTSGYVRLRQVKSVYIRGTGRGARQHLKRVYSTYFQPFVLAIFRTIDFPLPTMYHTVQYSTGSSTKMGLMLLLLCLPQE